MSKTIVYLAHPVGGDVPGNKLKILKLCRDITINYHGDIIPFVPYLSALDFLDDAKPHERALGFAANKEFFERRTFDELWLCGDHLSAGMKEEIKWCQEMDFYNIRCYHTWLRKELYEYLEQLNLENKHH